MNETVLNAGFNKTECIAVLRILIEVLNANAKVTPEMNAYLQEMINGMGINLFEYEEANNMTIGDSIVVLRKMSEKDKEVCAVIILKLLIADDYVADEELDVFLKVCKYANIKVPYKYLQ